MAALGRFASLTLACFHDLRVGEALKPPEAGSMFLNVGADVRAAATSATSESAFKFALYGIHETEESARQAHQERLKIAPWFEGAAEVWSAVLQPYRHFGSANFLAQEVPGPLYDCDAEAPDAGNPVVILTSVGWNPGAEKERIAEFSQGVAGVRISMTAVDGLHSQQTFSFPGGLEWDGLTVTFWRDQAAAMAWAYGAGLHRRQVKTERDAPRGDRTSFTRCVVVESSGIWHGTDPLAWA